MSITKKVIASVVALLVFVVVPVTLFAGTIVSEGNTPKDSYKNYTFFSATTTSATSTSIPATFDAQGRLDNGSVPILGADKVTIYFSRGDTSGQGNTGMSVFTVEVTPDDTNWYSFNKLVGSDISSTATSSVTISAATSTVVVSMDLTKDAFKALRCKVVETTDGEHSCSAFIQY